MVDDIDSMIDKKIEEKLGLYDTSSTRRTANEIRDKIQEELEKRPKTSTELENSINATKSTVERHCNHLEKVGAVVEEQIDGKTYWRLNK